MSEKQCADCYETIGDEVAALRHYVEEHPDSDTLQRVLDDVQIRVKCRECAEPTVGDLRMSDWTEGDQQLITRANCDSCEDENPLAKLEVRKVEPALVFDQRVDTDETDDREMNVYTIEKSVKYEGGNLLDATAHKDKAIDYARSKANSGRSDKSIDEWESDNPNQVLSIQKSDTTYVVRQWSVEIIDE